MKWDKEQAQTACQHLMLCLHLQLPRMWAFSREASVGAAVPAGLRSESVCNSLCLAHKVKWL